MVFLLMTGIMIAVSGCGYTIHGQGSLPFREISIGMLENRTLEPKLQDKLFKALTEEFLKQGVVVTPSAAMQITGVIKQFEMISLSEKKDVTVEYRVNIVADFRVKENDGKVRDLRKISSPFIVSFSGAGDIGSLIASKEPAEDRVMADVAMEVVGALIYK